MTGGETVAPVPSRRDPLAQECAKCGACTAVCPVYQVTGRESLTARGRLHLLGLAKAVPVGEMSDILSQCLLCGACAAVCPRGIDIPSLLVEARALLPPLTGLASLPGYLTQQALARPALLATLAQLARPLGLLPTLPQSENSQPPPAAAAAKLAEAERADPPALRQALYFSGCLAHHALPAIGEAARLLLDQLCGVQLLSPASYGCCGLAAKSAGDLAQARDLARRTIAALSAPGCEDLPVFTTCASCFAGLKGYPDLLANDPDWRVPAQVFGQRVWEFSSFILAHGRHPLANAFRRDHPPRPVVYHDPCHLRFAGITAPPRALLGQVPGLISIELPHGPRCCGHGGLFALTHAALAQRIAQPLVQDFLSTEAALVLTSCSGCLRQWQLELARAGATAQASHLALILAQELIDRPLPPLGGAGST